MAVRELFLICALALHPASFTHDDGGRRSPETEAIFWREWKWITDLLEHMYPDDEFLIIPNRDRKRPPGWEKVIFEWRGHSLYRKPKPDFYTSA